MKELVTNFPNQLNEGINIAKGVDLKFDRTITNVLICGLGGSGIGGELVKQWLRGYSELPIEVCHSYELPSYISSSSLVIACSYSGNTEETLSCLESALELDALIIGITSGGKMKEILDETNDQYILVPGGLPPRSALAYPLVQLIEIFEQSGVLNDSIKKYLSTSIDLLEKEQQSIISLAKELLEKSEGKKLILYSEDKFSPVLLRTCQQINENSKELAFYNVIPEMNHNEIVGWANDQNDFFVVMIRSNLENERNRLRLNITNDIISKKSDSINVHALGENIIEQSLYLIHIFDWLSVLIADEKNIDVVEVDVIDYLKSELAK